MRKLMLIFILITASLFGASFDCTKTKSYVEKVICQDEELSKLDDALSTIYASFYFLTKEIKSDQREWIKQRNQCRDGSCIKGAYTTRLEELNTSLTNQKTFPKTYLDAMKIAQETMQEVDPQKVTSVPYYKNQSKAFKEDFFRFRNITFKQPVIAEVKDYNDPKLKEILKECHGYRFDLQIGKYPHRVLEPGVDMYLSRDINEREPIIKPNLYIWQFNAKGKEWLFIRPTFNDGDYFVVDPNYCDKLRYDGDVAKALNRDKEFIVNSYTSNNGETSIITYNNKEYLITMNAFNKSISFWVTDILELSKHWKQFKLEVIGAEYAAITFEIILNFK